MQFAILLIFVPTVNRLAFLAILIQPTEGIILHIYSLRSVKGDGLRAAVHNIFFDLDSLSIRKYRGAFHSLSFHEHLA